MVDPGSRFHNHNLKSIYSHIDQPDLKDSLLQLDQMTRGGRFRGDITVQDEKISELFQEIDHMLNQNTNNLLKENWRAFKRVFVEASSVRTIKNVSLGALSKKGSPPRERAQTAPVPSLVSKAKLAGTTPLEKEKIKAENSSLGKEYVYTQCFGSDEQRKTILNKDKAFMAYLASKNNAAREVVSIESGGHKLQGEFYSKPENDGKTVLICSGSHGPYQKYVGTMADSYLQENYNVLLFNYSGFGESEGEPSENQIYADAEAAYQWLQNVKKVTDNKLIVHGYSLGGSAAAELGTKHPVPIILDRTFTRVRDAAKNQKAIGLWGKIASSVVDNYLKFDNIDKLTRQNNRVLIYRAGNEDKTMTAEQFNKLRNEVTPSGVWLECIEGSGGHFANEHDLWFSPYPKDDNTDREHWRRFIGN